MKFVSTNILNGGPKSVLWDKNNEADIWALMISPWSIAVFGPSDLPCPVRKFHRPGTDPEMSTR